MNSRLKSPGPGPDLRGRPLGPFVLDAELGCGDSSRVWRASRSDGLEPQTVAIKLLRPGHADADADAARFRVEQQNLARLQHPNIASLLHAGEAQADEAWFALELVKGLPITRHAQIHQLTVHANLALWSQALAVLHYVHSQGLLHADLKPEHLLINAQGTLKLLDFGSACALDSKSATAGLACSPNYAAPEQIEGGDLGPSSDIYALGVIAFELLVGRRPFVQRGPGLQAPQIDAQWQAPTPSIVLKSEYPEWSPQAAVLEAGLDQILLRCLAREPLQRYPSVQALMEELNAIRGQDLDSIQCLTSDRHSRAADGLS